ncbi:hypothetical protein [Streptomyces sp. NRRL F-5630]|uniref:hypothetical protein n=1 Tax=Streptomyces sp. NRRL F-5630 TaxID=1463864 RepID=UPI003D75AF7A
MKRRNVLTALSGRALTPYILPSAVAPAEALAAERREGTRVTAPLLGALQRMTDALRELDATSGSGNLSGTATRHLRVLLGLTKTGTYDERTGRRLAAVTADTAMQAGWYALDGGRHEAAQRLLLGAATAPMRAGDADAGCATGEEVLAMVRDVRSARLDDYLHAMLAEARRFGGARAVRSFVEHGEEVLRERVPA